MWRLALSRTLELGYLLWCMCEDMWREMATVASTQNQSVNVTVVPQLLIRAIVHGRLSKRFRVW
jgi:hypothetical protein